MSSNPKRYYFSAITVMLVLDFALFQMFYCTEKTLVLVELAGMANIFVIELALLLQN